jgi:hypothetical protein
MEVPGGPGVTGSVKAGTGITIGPDGAVSVNSTQNTTKLIAGSNISLSPTSGVGIVTISASGGGGGGEFAAGTAIVFAQASAPVGWVQDTTDNDAALRLVSGTGGGAGGSQSFSSAFASYTPQGGVNVSVSGLTLSGASTNQATVTSSGNVSVSVAVQGAGLSESQMPSHTHQVPSVFCNGQQSNPRSTGNGAGDGTRVSNPTGSGGQHSHGASGNASFSGGSSSHSHNVSGSVSGNASGSFAGTATTQFTVRYRDVIICTKS